MPPVNINAGEVAVAGEAPLPQPRYINVIYCSPPRSSTTTLDESAEAGERERSGGKVSGSGTGSSKGGLFGPTFQAIGGYMDRRFGLDSEDSDAGRGPH